MHLTGLDFLGALHLWIYNTQPKEFYSLQTKLRIVQNKQFKGLNSNPANYSDEQNHKNLIFSQETHKRDKKKTLMHFHEAQCPRKSRNEEKSNHKSNFKNIYNMHID